MDELLAQFVIEASELTQQAADDLLALEREPGNRAHIESAFRAVHTLKGSVGLFDMAPIHTALHAAEDVLSAANRPGGALDPVRIDPLIEIVEWTDRCVRELAGTGALGPGAGREAAELVLALARGGPADAGAAPGPDAVPDWAEALFAAHPETPSVAIRYTPRPDCFFSGDDPVALMAGVPGISAARVAPAEPWPSPAEMDPFRSNLVFEALSVAPRKDLEALFRLIPDQVALVSRPEGAATGPETPAPGREAQRTIRVGVDRIDRLVDTVGELLAAKNAMSDLVRQARRLEGGLGLARDIADAQQEFDRLTGRLRRAATGVRMVPLNETLRRLPRLVREISARTGKAADILIEGGEVEADKSIVDGLFDPLLHILRNALDHGIEPEPVRSAAGKPARGRISVSARQSGYRVEIAVADDGGGIDLEKVRAIAVERGLLSQADAAALGDGAARDLLFDSGFSTSSSVTELSGRGVGMDAVRSAVQRLGGRVELDGAAGQGTTVRLSLPTSFAVSRIMTVAVAGDTYGVPMEAISETRRIAAAAIAPVRAGEAFVLRDRTVPLVRLARLLGLPETRRAEELVLVAEMAGMSVGLVVEAIGERFETMLRPPAGLLKAVPAISGTTVLGDGRVVMVLDLEALIA